MPDGCVFLSVARVQAGLSVGWLNRRPQVRTEDSLMGWKIRVKHAHGQVAVDLSPRPPEDPMVVGRIADCDIEIPTTTVSRRHCLIYVQGDAWVVKDAGSKSGTFINGSRIVRPTMIEADDVISLGDDEAAPSLTMQYFDSPSGPIQAPAQPAARMPADVSNEEAAPVVAGPDSAVFDAESLGVASSRYYVPHQKNWSPGIIAATVLVTLLILGAAGLLFHQMWQTRHSDEAAAPAVSKPSEPKAPKSNAPRANVFSESTKPNAPDPGAVGAGAGVPAVVAKPGAPVHSSGTGSPLAPKVAGNGSDAPLAKPIEPTPPVSTVPNPSPTPQAPAANAGDEPTIPTDPRRATEAWQRVEFAHRAGKPSEALYVFENYRLENPAGPFLDEVSAFTDDAFDRLWWTRIRELFSQAQTFREQINKLDDDIRIENAADYKKKLQADRQGLAEQLLQVQTSLKAMDYSAPDPPDIDDDQKLIELKKSRPKDYFEVWKKRALNTIKYTRGARAF